MPWTQAIARRAVLRAMASLSGGLLVIRERAAASVLRFGTPVADGLQAQLWVEDPRFFSRIVTRGSLGAAEVAAEEDRGRLYGIEGVPAFIINGALVISGAQPPETMAAAFGRFVTATPSR